MATYKFQDFIDVATGTVISTASTFSLNIVGDISISARYAMVVPVYTIALSSDKANIFLNDPFTITAQVTKDGVAAAGETVALYIDGVFLLNLVDLGSGVYSSTLTLTAAGTRTFTAKVQGVTSNSVTVSASARTRILSVTSIPIVGVPFNFAGQYRATPYSATLTEGSHELVMPLVVVDPGTGDVYNFKKWEDNSTSPTRTIILTADMNLIATYEKAVVPPTTHTLQVGSDPVKTVEFTLNSGKQTTPFTGILAEATWIVSMPNPWNDYIFVKWNDEVTSPTRDILLTKDVSLVAYYTLKKPLPSWQKGLIVAGSIIPALAAALEAGKTRV